MRTIRQILVLGLCASGLWGQFTTGSTGADGAYSPTVSGDFDPVALGLNASGDNVFNFSTINIPAGVTIKLRASKLRNAAVTWLATGNVTIAGTLDLTGATPATLNTNSLSSFAASRVIAEPGPGGYAGGLGSHGGFGPQSGAGPGGGPGGLQSSISYACYGGTGSFITAGISAGGSTSGTPYGSYLLIPLYGGSGGGGGWDNASANNTGGNGGAGGGAIRIASNTQISVTGKIDARGGDSGTVSGTGAGCPGGSGAGGAIHLIAPALTGNGSLLIASGFQSQLGIYYTGIVRFSTNTNSFTGTTPGTSAVLGPLFLPPANSTLSSPSITITQVNGTAVPAIPGGQYLQPDVIINAAGAVSVNIAGANIPLGTAVNLRLTSETGPDQSITCPGLAGTVASSTATCTATFPFSVSIAGIRATW